VAAEAFDRYVLGIELVSSFDITTPDRYELRLDCGHVVEASESDVQRAPRDRGRLMTWACSECQAAERDSIVADLPGAD